MTRVPVLPFGLAAVIVLTAVASTAFGATSWLPVAAASAAWVAVIAPRRGPAFALAAVVLATLTSLLALLMLAHVFSWDLAAAVASASVVVGGIAVGMLWRSPRVGDWIAGWPLAAAVLMGGLVWSVALMIAAFLPSGASLAWAMNGDSANNILFARQIIADHGIAVGPEENPVPLTAGLMAVGMAAGRATLASDAVFAHDLVAFVALWAVVVVLVCAFAGLAVALLVPATRPRLRLVVGAGASLVPLSWLLVGYPIEYGFLNTHIALLVVLAAWVVFLRSDGVPASGLAALFLAGTLVLAIWGPMVLFPGSLGLVLVVRRFRALLAVRGAELMLLLLAFLQFAAYAAFVTLPSLLAQSGALAAAGGAYPFSRWMLVALVLATAALAVAGRRLLGASVMWGGVAWAASAAAGWGVLLTAARDTPDPFASYYPVKFAWLAGVVLFIAVLALAVGLATRLWRGWMVAVVALVLVGVVAVVALELLPTTRTGYARDNPVARVIRGDFWFDGDRGPRQVMSFADTENPTILWRSDDPNEGQVDFWVLQMQAGSIDGNFELRKAAYLLTGDATADELCDVLGLIDAPVHVVTADPALEGEVAEQCATTATFEVR